MEMFVQLQMGTSGSIPGREGQWYTKRPFLPQGAGDPESSQAGKVDKSCTPGAPSLTCWYLTTCVEHLSVEVLVLEKGRTLGTFKEQQMGSGGQRSYKK